MFVSMAERKETSSLVKARALLFPYFTAEHTSSLALLLELSDLLQDISLARQRLFCPYDTIADILEGFDMSQDSLFRSLRAACYITSREPCPLHSRLQLTMEV